MSYLIDTHAHLDFPELYDRFDEIIDASYQNNVNKIVTISTNLNKIEKIKDLSNNNKDVFFTVGTHPNEVLKDDNNSNYDLFSEIF